MKRVLVFLVVLLLGSGVSWADFNYSTEFNSLDRDFWLIFHHGRYGENGPFTQDYSLGSIDNGVLYLPVNTTDEGPELISKSIPIDENSVITVSWRAKVHYANEYFAGGVGFKLVNYTSFYYNNDENIAPYMYIDGTGNKKNATISTVYLRNYVYHNYDPPVGGNSFGICGGGECLTSPSVWDDWFTQKVEINIPQGVVKFWQNDQYIGEVPISKTIDLYETPYLRVWFSPYGWWTGHEMQIDWFRMEITDSTDTDSGNTAAGCEATFDLFSNTLHVPCLALNQNSLWLDLELTQTKPSITLALKNYGNNDNPALIDSACAASFDLLSNTFHIPCLKLDGKSYWLDLEIAQTKPSILLTVKNYGENAGSDSGSGSDGTENTGTSTMGQDYIGCFKDQGDPYGTIGRDLSGYMFSSPNMTVELCISECRKRGFAFAATQYGSQCFCGNSYGKYGRANNCNMPCSGNRSELCGGSWSNSVYSIK